MSPVLAEASPFCQWSLVVLALCWWWGFSLFSEEGRSIEFDGLLRWAAIGATAAVALSLITGSMGWAYVAVVGGWVVLCNWMAHRVPAGPARVGWYTAMALGAFLLWLAFPLPGHGWHSGGYGQFYWPD